MDGNVSKKRIRGEENNRYKSSEQKKATEIEIEDDGYIIHTVYWYVLYISIDSCPSLLLMLALTDLKINTYTGIIIPVTL